MDTKQLDELLALHGKATPGEWFVRDNCIVDEHGRIVARSPLLSDNRAPGQRDDAECIVATNNWALDFISQAREAIALRERLRTTCQALVNAAGADGPMSAEDAADRLVAKYAALRSENERLRAEVELSRALLADMDKLNDAEFAMGDMAPVREGLDREYLRILFEFEPKLRALLAPTPEVQR